MKRKGAAYVSSSAVPAGKRMAVAAATTSSPAPEPLTAAEMEAEVERQLTILFSIGEEEVPLAGGRRDEIN